LPMEQIASGGSWAPTQTKSWRRSPTKRGGGSTPSCSTHLATTRAGSCSCSNTTSPHASAHSENAPENALMGHWPPDGHLCRRLCPR
jgi:hypothetical protein